MTTTTTRLLLVVLTLASASAMMRPTSDDDDAAAGSCPLACTCVTAGKGKSRKNATICQEAGLSAIPSDVANLTNFLDVSGNRIATLGDDEFRSKGLLNLEAIAMDGSGVKEVRPTAFAGLKWLKELDLSNNSIVTLDRFVFADNKLLEMVNLSGNPIRALLSFQFTALPLLQELDFSSCAISVVEPDAFGNLLFLRTLSLRNNSLSTLPRDSFTWLKELDELDLRDNPWRCDDCDVQSLLILLTVRRLYTGDLRCYNAADNSTSLWQSIDPVNADAECEAAIQTSLKQNIVSLSKRLYEKARRFDVMDTGKKLFSSQRVETSFLPIALIAIAVTVSFLCLASCYAKFRRHSSSSSSSAASSSGVCALFWSGCCYVCCCCFDFCRSNKKYNDDDDDDDPYDFERTCYSNFDDQDCSDISLTVEL